MYSALHLQNKVGDEDGGWRWSHQARPGVQGNQLRSFCHFMPFYCLPMMCHEVSGQWRTSQYFSPLPDNSVKLGRSGFIQWEVLTDDGLGGSLFVCLYLSTWIFSFNPNTHHYLSLLPLLMTIILRAARFSVSFPICCSTRGFLPSRHQSEGNDSEGQKMRGPIRGRTPGQQKQSIETDSRRALVG